MACGSSAYATAENALLRLLRSSGTNAGPCFFPAVEAEKKGEPSAAAAPAPAWRHTLRPPDRTATLALCEMAYHPDLFYPETPLFLRIRVYPGEPVQRTVSVVRQAWDRLEEHNEYAAPHFPQRCRLGMSCLAGGSATPQSLRDVIIRDWEMQLGAEPTGRRELEEAEEDAVEPLVFAELELPLRTLHHVATILVDSPSSHADSNDTSSSNGGSSGSPSPAAPHRRSLGRSPSSPPLRLFLSFRWTGCTASPVAPSSMDGPGHAIVHSIRRVSIDFIFPDSTMGRFLHQRWMRRCAPPSPQQYRIPDPDPEKPPRSAPASQRSLTRLKETQATEKDGIVVRPQHSPSMSQREWRSVSVHHGDGGAPEVVIYVEDTEDGNTSVGAHPDPQRLQSSPSSGVQRLGRVKAVASLPRPSPSPPATETETTRRDMQQQVGKDPAAQPMVMEDEVLVIPMVDDESIEVEVEVQSLQQDEQSQLQRERSNTSSSSHRTHSRMFEPHAGPLPRRSLGSTSHTGDDAQNPQAKPQTSTSLEEEVVVVMDLEEVEEETAPAQHDPATAIATAAAVLPRKERREPEDRSIVLHVQLDDGTPSTSPLSGAATDHRSTSVSSSPAGTGAAGAAQRRHEVPQRRQVEVEAGLADSTPCTPDHQLLLPPNQDAHSASTRGNLDSTALVDTTPIARGAVSGATPGEPHSTSPAHHRPGSTHSPESGNDASSSRYTYTGTDSRISSVAAASPCRDQTPSPPSPAAAGWHSVLSLSPPSPAAAMPKKAAGGDTSSSLPPALGADQRWLQRSPARDDAEAAAFFAAAYGAAQQDPQRGMAGGEEEDHSAFQAATTLTLAPPLPDLDGQSVSPTLVGDKITPRPSGAQTISDTSCGVSRSRSGSETRATQTTREAAVQHSPAPARGSVRLGAAGLPPRLPGRRGSCDFEPDPDVPDTESSAAPDPLFSEAFLREANAMATAAAAAWAEEEQAKGKAKTERAYSRVPQQRVEGPSYVRLYTNTHGPRSASCPADARWHDRTAGGRGAPDPPFEPSRFSSLNGSFIRDVEDDDDDEDDGISAPTAERMGWEQRRGGARAVHPRPTPASDDDAAGDDAETVSFPRLPPAPWEQHENIRALPGARGGERSACEGGDGGGVGERWEALMRRQAAQRQHRHPTPAPVVLQPAVGSPAGRPLPGASRLPPYAFRDGSRTLLPRATSQSSLPEDIRFSTTPTPYPSERSAASYPSPLSATSSPLLDGYSRQAATSRSTRMQTDQPPTPLKVVAAALALQSRWRRSGEGRCAGSVERRRPSHEALPSRPPRQRRRWNNNNNTPVMDSMDSSFILPSEVESEGGMYDASGDEVGPYPAHVTAWERQGKSKQHRNTKACPPSTRRAVLHSSRTIPYRSSSSGSSDDDDDEDEAELERRARRSCTPPPSGVAPHRPARHSKREPSRGSSDNERSSPRKALQPHRRAATPPPPPPPATYLSTVPVRQPPLELHSFAMWKHQSSRHGVSERLLVVRRHFVPLDPMPSAGEALQLSLTLLKPNMVSPETALPPPAPIFPPPSSSSGQHRNAPTSTAAVRLAKERVMGATRITFTRTVAPRHSGGLEWERRPIPGLVCVLGEAALRHPAATTALHRHVIHSSDHCLLLLYKDVVILAGELQSGAALPLLRTIMDGE
eukprot:gene8192-5718_t